MLRGSEASDWIGSEKWVRVQYFWRRRTEAVSERRSPAPPTRKVDAWAPGFPLRGWWDFTERPSEKPLNILPGVYLSRVKITQRVYLYRIILLTSYKY
jgi:hypothetical protein